MTKVTDGCIHLKSGQKVSGHFTIIATDANHLVKNLRKQHTHWKSCETLYFKVNDMETTDKLIHLMADKDSLVNNVVFVSNQLGIAKNGQVISATVVKPHDLQQEDLVKKVIEELMNRFAFNSIEFLKYFAIPKALPESSNLKGEITPRETRLTTQTFLAGDTLLNGSLNSAMLSGERAAQGVIQLLEESPDLAQFTSEYL